MGETKNNTNMELKRAVISECNLYRYELHRTWDKSKPKVLFIMLNPSTADAMNDDATTIRCINYAKRWGFGSMMIGNIYPYRAKSPRRLMAWKTFGERYSVFKENQQHVEMMIDTADLIVCAWGSNYQGIPKWLEYYDLHYLELCKDGITPKHPLGNLSKDLTPRHYGGNPAVCFSQTKYE